MDKTLDTYLSLCTEVYDLSKPNPPEDAYAFYRDYAIKANGPILEPMCGTGRLNRSPVTPPNYVFPIAWTILYGIIGACGWLIWRSQAFPKLSIIKTLYVTQLILNWSWTPLFFGFHLTVLSLVFLGTMDILVFALICLAYQKMRAVSLLMIPYLLWILFATYLNFYIWQYN